MISQRLRVGIVKRLLHFTEQDIRKWTWSTTIIHGVTHYVVVNGFSYASQPNGTFLATEEFCITAVQIVVSVNELNNDAKVSVYTNSTHGQFVVESNYAFTKVEIVNLLGEIVLSKVAVNNVSRLSNNEKFAEGVYPVKTYSDDTKSTVKMVVE